MTIIADHLVEIQHKDLPILREMYNSPGGRTHTAYTTIDNYIRWIEHGLEERKYIKFLCLNGDFSDGTFVVTERTRAYADTLADSYDNLKRLLQLMDYTNGYFFLSVRGELRPIFNEALDKANIGIGHEYKNLFYYLPKEEALKFNTKREDVEVRSIKELKNFEKIDSQWSLRSSTSLTNIQRYAKYNVNAGAYRNDGTLVAWTFRFVDGLIGILQTDEKYLGHGYGSLVVKASAKKFAQMGRDSYAAVNEQNIASRTLFSRLGFIPIGYVYCIVTENAWNSTFT